MDVPVSPALSSASVFLALVTAIFGDLWQGVGPLGGKFILLQFKAIRLSNFFLGLATFDVGACCCTKVGRICLNSYGLQASVLLIETLTQGRHLYLRYLSAALDPPNDCRQGPYQDGHDPRESKAGPILCDPNYTMFIMLLALLQQSLHRGLSNSQMEVHAKGYQLR